MEQLLMQQEMIKVLRGQRGGNIASCVGPDHNRRMTGLRKFNKPRVAVL
jgi:hypothetical protein